MLANSFLCYVPNLQVGNNFEWNFAILLPRFRFTRLSSYLSYSLMRFLSILNFLEAEEIFLQFLKVHSVSKIWYGMGSVSFSAPKIWNILPKEIKNSEMLNAFKAKIKNWVPQECHYRLCKTYVSQVEFI